MKSSGYASSRNNEGLVVHPDKKILKVFANRLAAIKKVKPYLILFEEGSGLLLDILKLLAQKGPLNRASSLAPTL